MNSVSVRIFFITDDNEILKVPIAKFERMLKGSQEENTERFAGKRIRAAEIAVMVEDRKPVMVLRAIYFYLHFNEKGILDFNRFLNSGKPAASRIVGTTSITWCHWVRISPLALMRRGQ